MIRLVFLESNGTRHDVAVAPGVSMMEAAVRHGVPGIVGACGGSCACATCQVYLPGSWRAVAGERSADETTMLEYAVGVRDSSRLACQVRITADMDGMVVHLPEADACAFSR